MEDKQQRNLRNYHHQARLLLTERERDHLHDMLKEYQKYHNARQFISDLRSILNTPAKMDLLREIRNLVPPAYLHEFDALAPYDRMAHPMATPFMQDAPVFKRSPSWHGRAYERAFDTQSEDLDMSHYVSTGPRVLTITNKNEDLGFTIKGGSEQGTPVSVSRVERGSEAEKNGLTVGDEILEVNNINFEEIAISSAIRVLQGSARLRMTVQHNPALVQQSQRRQSKEKTKWFDTYSRAKGPPAGLNTSPPGFNRERKVIIQLDEKHRFIGFNIRGGSEYGLGIFVSKTDRGGMAEFHKIQVGDQILSVNGTSCENIPHAAAVDLIRGQKRLVLIIRSMGPDTLNQSQNKSHRSQSTTPSMIAGLPSQQQQKSPPFPNGPVPPIPKQNKDWLTRAQPHGGVQRLEARDMKKQSPGENAPIIMSARQSNQGIPHLSNTTITDHLPSRPPSAQSQLSTQRTQPYPHPPSQPHPQPYPQTHPQPHPQAHTQQQLRQSPPHRSRGGDSGGKEKKRGLGRSLSVKHPGERKLPVMEESPKSKPVKVKRNKTFRALFGLKPKVKAHEKEHHQGDRSPEREILPPSPKKDPDEEILAESFEEDLARVDPIGQEAGAHEEDIGVVVEKEGKRHRKGKSKMTGIIASFRKTRPENIVKKRHNIALPPEEELERPPSVDRPGSATSWASRKDSLGESLSNSSHGSLGKQKGAFMAGAGTQIMHVHASQASQMPILTEAIKKTLSEDEAAAVHRHIKRYHTEGDIDSLVTPLLAILDKPEKVVLLREVRGVIAPLDLAVFDSMVSKRELEARNYLNAKSGSVSPRLSFDRKLLPGDQHDSNQPGTSNNYEKEMEKQKRHQNELERLRKQRQEEVRQATLTATGRSLDDPSPYGQLGYPANQTRHGSFDTYSYGERRDQAPQSFSTFKGVASGGSGGGSPASSISDGSLSKKTAKRVLINAAPQIIRTNSAGDDVSPRSEEGEYGGQDEGDSVQNNVFEDRLERGKYERGSGWDPYETIPMSRLGDENQDSPKIQNNEFAGRRQLNQDSGARNMSNFDPPYATIKVNPLMDNAADTTDANESDHDSEDSDYSISKKNGMYRIMGSDPEENFDNRGTSSPPKSTTKAHKLSPIPASPPSPRIIEPTPPSSPLAASQNLDALLQVRPNPVLTPNRDGTNSNRSSGSSSDDPIYAQVNKAAAKTPGNFLDVRDSVDSASESESSAKRVSFSEFNGSPKPPRKGILKNSFNRNERPTVPIRNPQLYLDDDDDDEPSPLKEIVRNRQGKSPIKPAARRRIDGFPGREIFEFELSKSQSSLGLSLTGGKDYKNQPYVKVDRIYPGGAVADDGNLTSGCVLVGVDGVSLLDVSHHQAMEIIRSAYNDKSKKTMQIEFMDAI